MRKSRREVTRELGEQGPIAWISRMRQTTLGIVEQAQCRGLAVLLMLTYWLKRSRTRALHSHAASLNRAMRRGYRVLPKTHFRLFVEVMRKSRRELTAETWLQKFCFAFLFCVSMCSRHIAPADTAARPSQGRRSRKVMIIVPLS
jgi:hypothetical protein